MICLICLCISQKHSSGSLVIKIDPGYQESAGITEQFMCVHFDYNPSWITDKTDIV